MKKTKPDEEIIATEEKPREKLVFYPHEGVTRTETIS